MNFIVHTITSLAMMVAACFRWFYRDTIAPAEAGHESLPPIRCDNPQDIYLA